MKHLKNLKRKISYFLFAVAILITAVFGIVNFNAEEDNVPDHFKGLTSNEDGTYKLSLDVTGSSDPEHKVASNVNVVIVYDVSQSMDTNVPNSRNSRGDQAESVVHKFIADLAEYQDQNNPQNIQMALVTFGVTANTQSGWTSDLSGMNENFEENGTNGRTHFNYNSYGTNWEQALAHANTLIESADDDPTFVILVTDGAPTATGNGSDATSPSGKTAEQLRRYYSAALPYAKSIQGRENTTLYGIYIYGNEADLLDDLMHNSFVVDGSERPIGGDTVEAQNYYNAADTSELQNAIDEIFNQVVQAMGISSVKISDGTTTSVKASAQTVHLLKVDEESYKYWLSMDVKKVEGQSNTYTNSTTGNTITFTKEGNNYIGTWTDDKGNHSITGTIETIQDPKDDSKTKTIFKMEWTNDGNALHPEAPTPAQLVSINGNDSVDWDLSSHGVLLNGVTYTVTFDVWPTQYTYDLIADLNNDTVKYDDLKTGSGTDYDGLDKYISKTLTGDYYLKTNTTATLSYKDTRLENPETEYSNYVNPPAQELKADKIDVIKKWENYFDSESGNPIDIILNRTTDTSCEEFYRTNLSFLNDYKEEDISISTGLMRLKKNSDGKTGKVQILESGHDYSFEEASEHYYKWELVAQTVHPMLINGELHELILLDDAATRTYLNDELPTYSIPEDMPADSDYYNDGEHEYIRMDGKLYVIAGTNPTIKAFNYRRSNLNLTKKVNGENANPDELFEFKITVNDPGLSSNEKLWFSVFDENNEVIIDENLPVSAGWTPEVKNGNFTGFYYGENGSELTVSLKEGQNLRFTNLTTQATYTIVESDKDNYVFTDAEGKAEYGENHNTINYVKDTDYKVNKDSKTITGDITLTNSTFSIEVKNTYELATIDLTKVWDDANNQDGKRPDEIKVQIKRQIGENSAPENYGDPITITKDSVDKTDSNKWIYSIESTEELALPRFDSNGEEYLYSVEELAVSDYETIYSPNKVNQTEGKATYTITNKHTPELYNRNGELEVTKHWDDFDNEDGLRKPVTIELYKNGNPTGKTITLTTSQDSKDKFTDLPMYENGVEIKYTIVETTTLEKYEAPKYDMNTIGSYKVTNKHTPLYNNDGELEITKIWDDVQNIDDIRKDVTIELYINGKPSGKTITLTVENDSKDKFTKLPKYDENGDEIKYTVVETTTLDGYEEPKYDTSKEGTFTVTNKHVPLYNEDGELEVTKIWDDFDNEDNLRKDVTIELYINDKPSGKTITLTTDQNSNDKFTKLPKYDEKGNVINYTIVETTTLEKYEAPKYDTSKEGSFTVTNKHVPLYNEDGELEVTKIWDDFDNEDNLRKDVTIELYINDKPSGKTITLTTEQNSNDKFTKLPKYDENGNAINYSIVETTTLEKYEEPKYDMSTEGTFTVTNKHTPLYNKDGNLKVTKYWEDNDNYDGLRKDVTIELYINGKPSGKTVKLTTVDGSNDLFNNLPKYDENGDEIKYTIVETTTLTGYEVPDYNMKTPGDYKVTNVHGVVPVSIDVTKIWIDNANQDGKRKDEITVKIFANGEFLKNETIKGDVKEDTWTYTIRGLDRYKDGEEIKYTLEEVQVADYEEPVVSGNAEDGFTIKNTHNPSKISKTGTKTWDHKDNQFKYPESITVTLHAKVGDEELYTKDQTVTEKDGKWEYSFTELDEYKDGKIITYWVDEAPVTDYKTVIDEEGNITNTYAPEKITINGTKTWDDENNQDGKRPDHITVILHGKVDGTEIKEVKQEKDVYEKDGKWEYKFEDVLKYAGGKEIEYSIEELPVDEYDEPIIHGTADEGFSITNHHTPETITYIVKKNWDDYNNADEIRPDSINVTLYKTVDGVRSEKQRFTISEANDWTYTFKDLPRYEGGKEITYDIVEDVVDGYKTSYETNDDTVDDKIQINTTITNTQTIDITINKTWDDQDNHDGIRPEYIIVNIFANGDYIDSIRISKDDNWKKVIEGLLKYQNGVLITYTIEEETVEGYTTIVDGYNITNTHEVKPKEEYHIEVMPPKTGIDETNNNYLSITIFLIGIYEILIKNSRVEILNNKEKVRY